MYWNMEYNYFFFQKFEFIGEFVERYGGLIRFFEFGIDLIRIWII